MQVAEISISRWEAEKKWLEYRRACPIAGAGGQDDALRRAYRFLSRGRRVLGLHEVIRTAGLDANQRPRFAIARLHWTFARLYRYADETTFSDDDVGNTGWHSPRLCQKFLRLAAGTFARPQTTIRGGAVVPTIPPDLRPHKAKSKYLILWEAEWQNVPTDPILLSPLGADLYLVCAQWDLSPLERSVLFAKQ